MYSVTHCTCHKDPAETNFSKALELGALRERVNEKLQINISPSAFEAILNNYFGDEYLATLNISSTDQDLKVILNEVTNYEGDALSDEQFSDYVRRTYAGYKKAQDAKLVTQIIKLLLVKASQDSIYNTALYYLNIDWDEFSYLTFPIIFESLTTSNKKTITHRQIFRLIVKGFAHKELVNPALDMYEMLFKHYQFDSLDIVQYIKLAVKFCDNQWALAQNLINYILPRLERKFDIDRKEMIQIIFDESIDVMNERLIKHCDENNITRQYSECVSRKMIPNLIADTDEEILDNIFCAICRITKKNYKYSTEEIEYVINYAEHSLNFENTLKHIVYFISHIFIIGHLRLQKGQDIQPWIEVLHYIRAFCIRMLESEDAEHAMIGGHVYIVVIDVFLYNKTRLMYSSNIPKYKIGHSPFYRELLKRQQFDFGKLPDVHTIYSFLKMNNCCIIFKLLKSLKNSGQILNFDNMMRYVLQMFIRSKETHLQERIDEFMAFVLTKCIPSERELVKYTEKIIKSFKKSLQGPVTDGKDSFVILHILRCLMKEISSDGIRKNDALRDFRYTLMELPCMCMLDRKLIGDWHTVTAELVLLISGKMGYLTEDEIQEVLQFSELIIKANIRKTSYDTSLVYKHFVNITSETNVEFYKRYLLQQLRNLNPKLVKKSKLRRATEYRAVISSLCCGAAKEYQKEMIDLAVDAFFKMKDSSNNDLLIIACHCLNELMKDSKVRAVTSVYEFPMVVYSFKMIGRHNFQLNNAAYGLFETVVNRMFPLSCNTRNISLSHVLKDHPMLQMVCSTMGNKSIDTDTKVFVLAFLNRLRKRGFGLYNELVDEFILPICLEIFDLSCDSSLFLKMELFINIIPPHKMYDCFTILYNLIRIDDVPLQVYSNCFYILCCLLYKSHRYILDNFLTEDIEKWKRMKENLLNLAGSSNARRLREIGLINIAEFDTEIVNYNAQYLAVVMKYLTIDESVNMYEIFVTDLNMTEMSKIAATEYLISRVEQENNFNKRYGFVKTATIAMLKLNCFKPAENLYSTLLHILINGNIIFTEKEIKPLRILTVDQLKTRFKSTKFSSLYVKVLSSLNVNLLKSLHDDLFTRYFTEDDNELAVTLPHLYKVTGNKAVILTICIYMLMYSDYEVSMYIMRAVEKYLLGTPHNFEYVHLIEIIFTQKFLYQFFCCPRKLVEFLSLLETRLPMTGCHPSPVITQQIMIGRGFIYKILRQLRKVN